MRARRIQYLTPVMAPNHTLSRRSLADYPDNVAVFIPFGFLGCRCLGGGRSLFKAAGIVFTGMLFSLGIEFLQLFTETRYTSWTDVATNTLGTLIGVWIAWRLSASRPVSVRAR